MRREICICDICRQETSDDVDNIVINNCVICDICKSCYDKLMLCVYEIREEALEEDK